MTVAFRSMPIFIVEFLQKTRIPTDTYAKRQEIFRHALKISPAPNRTHKRTHGEEKFARHQTMR
jgi:hypothetical protein